MVQTERAVLHVAAAAANQADVAGGHLVELAIRILFVLRVRRRELGVRGLAAELVPARGRDERLARAHTPRVSSFRLNVDARPHEGRDPGERRAR